MRLVNGAAAGRSSPPDIMVPHHGTPAAVIAGTAAATAGTGALALVRPALSGRYPVTYRQPASVSEACTDYRL